MAASSLRRRGNFCATAPMPPRFFRGRFNTSRQLRRRAIISSRHTIPCEPRYTRSTLRATDFFKRADMPTRSLVARCRRYFCVKRRCSLRYWAARFIRYRSGRLPLRYSSTPARKISRNATCRLFLQLGFEATPRVGTCSLTFIFTAAFISLRLAGSLRFIDAARR